MVRILRGLADSLMPNFNIEQIHQVGGKETETLNKVAWTPDMYKKVDVNLKQWQQYMSLSYVQSFEETCRLHGPVTDAIKKNVGHTHYHCSFAEVVACHLKHPMNEGLDLKK